MSYSSWASRGHSNLCLNRKGPSQNDIHASSFEVCPGTVGRTGLAAEPGRGSDSSNAGTGQMVRAADSGASDSYLQADHRFGEPPVEEWAKNRRNLLEFLLRVQTIGLGYMPDGVPAMRAVRPLEFTPMAGPAIAERFMAAAEAMDVLLVAGRKKFGVEACGQHPFFGVMRIDEWRRYHAIHAQHHEAQLRNAIRYARSLKTV